MNTVKTCSICNVTKATSEFYSRPESEDGFRNNCKKCHTSAAKQRYRKNKDAKIKYAREYRKLAPERVRQSKAAYYKKNKQKINKKNAEYMQNNRHIKAEITARRKARKLNATPHWLTKEDLEIIKWIYQARDCYSKAKGVLYHVDHIVPLQGKDVCGLHVWWNMQLLPAEQNLSKGNKNDFNEMAITGVQLSLTLGRTLTALRTTSVELG